MRKEPFTVDNYIHVYNRGNRKLPIVHDSKDRWRFLQMLRYFNDEYSPPNIFRELHALWKSDFYNRLEWPEEWPKHKPLVKILAFALMDNHYHLLLKEIREGGVTAFMRKLGTGMTNYYNTKYEQVGRLFQGAYKAKLIDDDEYLRYLAVYIHIKNPLESYPGGLEGAVREINKALDWAARYPYSSAADYLAGRNSPIIDKDILGEIFTAPREHKNFSRDCMLSMKLDDKLEGLTFEE